MMGWSVSAAATSVGVSRPTAYKWLTHWRQEGPEGLLDHSSRPHRSPRRLPEEREQEILTLRRRLRIGPRRIGPLVGLYHSTVSVILQRHGLSPLGDLDHSPRNPDSVCPRSSRGLIHLNMKPLARIPRGGGHSIHGLSPSTKHQGGGYEVLHVAVDDASRLTLS